MAAAPVLTRKVEWNFLRFVRGLYFPEAPDAIGVPPSRPLDPLIGLSGTGADRPLLAALAPVIAKGTWRFLVRRGGYRNKDVIVAGKKRTGRIWEEPIWGKTPLAIGHGTVLWLSVLWDALAAVHTRAPEALSRTLTAALDAPLSPGDRLALAAALTHFARDRDSWRQLPDSARALGLRIPLFGLAHPALLPAQVALEWPLEERGEAERRAGSPPGGRMADQGRIEERGEAERRAGSPPGGRMADQGRIDSAVEQLSLQYLDEWLVSSWVESVTGRGRRDVADVRAWDDGMVRAIDALFKAAAPSGGRGAPQGATAGLEHLLVPLARFYPVLLYRFGGADELRKNVDQLSRTLTSTGEREAFETAFGTVLRGGVRLDALVTQILATPWPDRTDSQKRLAAEHETHYRAVRDEIRVLSRSLRREVG